MTKRGRPFLVGWLALALTLGAAGGGLAAEPDGAPLPLTDAVADPAAEPEPVPAAAANDRAVSDRAVLEDIERTLRDLSGHVRVAPRRIRVGGAPAERGEAVMAVPAAIEIPVGKSHLLDLPASAREVIVGNPAVADVVVSSRRRLFIMGRQPGRSNVFVLDAAGRLAARVDVTVGVDVAAVRSAIRRQFPDAAVTVDTQGDNLTLSGAVTSDGIAGRIAAIARQFVDADAKVLNLLTVNREQQVLIQVRVAEVQRTFLKEIGVSIPAIGGEAPVFKDLNLGGVITARGLTRAGLSPAAALTFSGIRDLTAILNLLEERGVVRSLAEPNLVAVSGETAQMLAGGEYPIPTPSEDGIVITYKPFGVTLSFLPVVMDSGRINLKLTTEVSALGSTTVSFAGGTVNSFTVRRAASTVELPNGGSLMIAGLIQNDILSGLAGVPGAMDLPILGQLFRSDSYRRNETELVVIVNALLVRPTAPSTLVSPVDTISPGGDLDMWLFGKLTGRYAPGFVQDAGPAARRMPLFGFTLDEFAP